MTDATCWRCKRPVTVRRDDRDRKIISCPKGSGGCGAWSRLDPADPFPEPWAAQAPPEPAPADPVPAEPANPKQPEPDRDDSPNPFAIW